MSYKQWKEEIDQAIEHVAKIYDISYSEAESMLMAWGVMEWKRVFERVRPKERVAG